jgi:hypothetical protein
MKDRKNMVDPTSVDRGMCFRVVDKDSKYYGHEGIVVEVHQSHTLLELNVNKPGHAVNFEWHQLEACDN